MPLFQKSVIAKYLKTQDKTILTKLWNDFKNHFHNPTIQENIRNSKEERYQEGFLRDLFVKILGYSLNPDANFNLTTEYKNVKDSKKADGAIIIEEKVRAVIELKGTNTTDLGKIETQAFGYKNNQPDCTYIVTSNFEKIRFYIDNAIEHIEFNLFTLTEADFDLLYLCLGFDNIAKNIAKKIKDESLSEEDVITKKLYKDYSLFKRELHQNLVELNPDYEPLELFKKSQKLLDRFLFLFFGEDRHLLPPNSVRLILAQWNQLRELDEYTPLYDRFKKYFGYLNTGYKGKQYDVFAYNGGLFKPDEILDSIKIDDNLLYNHTLKLSEYDFASEVDVNILGHIFENSLNELDEIKAQLEGQEIDKTKTKRKKDGVFYTPKYITKYIVENTIGKLCEEKKAEVNIIEEDYHSNKGLKPLAKKLKQPLLEKLTDYRNWLLQLTICDPACGSGAFLNQALDFLIEEHRYIDELQAKLFGDAMVLSDAEKSILENNLFGVDLNEESVEIAKLSLWLRTAQSNRKLNDLNNNIKCGNSLIDDVAVAGDKAFNWQTAFPQVFKEKQKKAFHITTAIHDSRTSQRMIDHKVREKRAMGTMPEPQINYLTDDDEMVIAETVSTLVKEQNLNILGFNVCKDHIHIILVCEEEAVDEIVRKIKGRTAREVNKSHGVNPVINKEYHSNNGLKPIANATEDNNNRLQPIASKKAEKSVPLWTQKFGCKEIVDENQLSNTIEYVKNNRAKHNLPPHSNKGFKPLVESIACDHDYAFRDEYKGGFDVIIGNPPYVRAELLSIYKDYFSKKFEVYHSASDLFSYFYELSVSLIKDNGIMGFISNTFDKTNAGFVLRNYLQSKTNFEKYIDFTEVQIFEGATTYPVIITLNKKLTSKEREFEFVKIPKSSQAKTIDIALHKNVAVNQDLLSAEAWSFSGSNETVLLKKISDFPTIKEKYGKCYRGIITGLNDAFIVKGENNSNHIKPIYEGKEIKKWLTPNSEQNLIFFESKWTKRTYGNEINESEALEKLKIDFPKIMKILLPFEDLAKKRYDKGDFWWELRNCAYYDLFEKPKIIFPNLQNSNKFAFDAEGVYINAPAVFLPVASKALLCILNSKIVWKFLLSICVVRSGGYIEVKPQYFEQIPIPIINEEQEHSFIEKADLMLTLNKEFQLLAQKFQRTLQRKFFDITDDKGFKPLVDAVTLPKKLQDWYLLSYGDFIKELGKKKVKLSLSQESEWEDYFIQEQKKAITLKTQIDNTDAAIDKMVYELYGLTEEEIGIVESSN
ncbi:Eco57I restriction-modification methylase domain-containing protein [Flavobacterium restrictum]|uniref:site-specific DNA-methyltransferase (adenine-specific) n=1 Tax=Flavobacterium restrictum TaxID=2594428 RepID=A0A553DU67_9FLAO|nr:TaqI-like C-terminal specificity domain-containing protein [Flavobacterium restrictum]TRX36318.1 N-6 DNA methylase [Flavobacterium restrictum]